MKPTSLAALPLLAIGFPSLVCAATQDAIHPSGWQLGLEGSSDVIFTDDFELGNTTLWSLVEGERPTLSVQAPTVDQVISIVYATSTPGWSVQGTDAVGVVSFTTGGAAGGTYTLRYAGEGPLSDSTGTLFADRMLTGDGPQDVLDVHLPSRDEGAAVMLEVEVENAAGTSTTVAVALNVDLDPPSEVALTTDAPDPDTTPLRRGDHQLDWTASTDDLGGGGSVGRYELRAIAEPLPASWATVDWDDLAIWNAQLLLATPDASTTSLAVDQLGLDRRWHLAVRAFDEAGNPSAVSLLSEVEVSTQLRTVGLGAVPALVTAARGLTHLGDVNADGFSDLIAHGDGGALLLLGEASPGATAGISAWPSIADPATSAFGSSATPVGDVNGDGIDDFTIGALFDCAVYLFFGIADDPTELATHDVVLEGPGFSDPGGCPDVGFTNITEISLSRTGPGNFADVDVGPTTLAYDDIFFDTFDFGSFGADLYLVLGRSQADWSALGGRLAVLGASDAPDPDTANCSNGVITIYGDNPPDHPENGVTLPTSRIGYSAGFSDLDGDDFEDLIVGTDYIGNIAGSPPSMGSQLQYLFYGDGRQLPSCGLGARDLSTSLGGSPDGRFVVNPGAGSTATTDIQLAADSGAAGYLVGAFVRDRLLRYLSPMAWDDVPLEIGPPNSISTADVRFARSVGYAGNMDGDPEGAVDLIIGAPSTEGSGPGIGYAFLALGEPSGAAEEYRADAATTVEVLAAPAVGTRVRGGLTLVVPDAPRDCFGSFVAGGLDYDGDGDPDVVVADTTDGSLWLYH